MLALCSPEENSPQGLGDPLQFVEFCKLANKQRKQWKLKGKPTNCKAKATTKTQLHSLCSVLKTVLPVFTTWLHFWQECWETQRLLLYTGGSPWPALCTQQPTAPMICRKGLNAQPLGVFNTQNQKANKKKTISF